MIQSLEFIRSSLNSLDVAAEFECARGLSDDDDESWWWWWTVMMMMTVVMMMMMVMNRDDDDLTPEFKWARSLSFVTDNLLLWYANLLNMETINKFQMPANCFELWNLTQRKVKYLMISAHTWERMWKAFKCHLLRQLMSVKKSVVISKKSNTKTCPNI